MSPEALLELEEKSHLIHLDEATQFVDDLYELEVSECSDEDFEVLERVIDKVFHALSTMPSAEFRPLLERLLAARAGVEQGMAPNPAKRPSLQQLQQFVADHL